MASLIGKKISEVYTQLILRDLADGYNYYGDGTDTKLTMRYDGTAAGGRKTTVNGYTLDIPALSDTGSGGSLAFGKGFSAFDTMYPVLGAATSSQDPVAAPISRIVMGHLGIPALKAANPGVYDNLRTYQALTSALTTVGVRVELSAMDNSAGLNSIAILRSIIPNLDSGGSYTTLSNSKGGNIKIDGDSTGFIYSGNFNNTVSLGAPNNKWKEIFCGNATINTSDAREKSTPLPITDEVLDAWGDVQIVTGQWLASIQQKGADVARWHFWPIAQQVRDAFAARGLDGTRYGLLCYDEWPEKEDEEGNIIPAGNAWGIRPSQCHFLEAAYQRRRCDRIEARLAALESK